MATEAIQRVKEEFGEIPKDATRIIQFLNSKNKYELQELEIKDRTEKILEVRKVLSKRTLMLNLEDKCQNMQVAIDSFMAIFQILREKGLPSPLAINGKLMTQQDYNRKITNLAKEQVSTSSIKEFPTSTVLYQTFENLFYLQHEVKHLFINKPTFSKYSEADEIYRRMLKIQLTDVETWQKLTDLL